jgi:23S rRNA (uracil1939-C5)-methyltransferase
VLDLSVCLLTGERGNAIREAFVSWARQASLEPYDQTTHAGYLRHLVVREGRRTGDALCVLVTSPGAVPQVDELENALAGTGVVGVLHAVNDGVAEVTGGLAARPLFGRTWFEEEILGLRLRVSAGAFLQTNTGMCDLLYRDAIEQAALTGGEVVWDLYSGIGSIALALAGRARRVIGVEIAEEAVQRARENALLNGIGNVEFVAGDAGRAIRPLLEQGLPRPDVAVVDPPRAGLGGRAVRRIFDLAPRRVVYVSCNPATLAGDALLLGGGGYVVARVRPFDLFPHTPHVECVALFERAGA